MTEMIFLCRVGGLLRERVRSSDICRQLRVESLLPHDERSHLRWIRHLIRMPPGHLPLEVLLECVAGQRQQGKPRTHLRDYIFHLAWGHLLNPKEELENIC